MQVAQGCGAEDGQRQPGKHAAVAGYRRWVEVEPQREPGEHYRQCVGNQPEQSTKGECVKGLRDRASGEEPQRDAAEHRENHQHGRERVASVLFRQAVGPHRAGSTAERVGEPVPDFYSGTEFVIGELHFGVLLTRVRSGAGLGFTRVLTR